MSLLPRAYRVLAESPAADTHLIVTSSRSRAIRYLGLFLKSGWKEGRIELGNKVFTEANLKDLP